MLGFLPECSTDQHVGEHRLAVECNGGLKRASESKPRNLMRAQTLDLAAFELDGSARGVVDTRDAVEQRRLAGAVGPDDRIDLAGLNGKTQIADREQPSVGLADLLALKDRHLSLFDGCWDYLIQAGSTNVPLVNGVGDTTFWTPSWIWTMMCGWPIDASAVPAGNCLPVWSSNEMEPVVPRQMTDSVAFATAL